MSEKENKRDIERVGEVGKKRWIEREKLEIASVWL